MSYWDESIYEFIAIKRSQLFKPIAVVLSKLTIRPDALSYLGVVFAIWFAFEVAHNMSVAFWILIGMLICDQLDGAIARYTKSTSDRGKFVDVAVDTTTFAIVMIGLAHAGLVGAATAIMYVYLATICRVLLIISRNINRKSQWLFFASAGPIPSTFIYATYLLFAFASFSQYNYIAGSSQVFAGLLALFSLKEFLWLRYRKI